MMRLIRPALVIARRDFTAIVLTPTFLIFLLAPLLMFLVGTVGGMGAQRFVTQSRTKERLVAIAAPAELAAVRRADLQLRGLFIPEDEPPPLELRTSRGDPEAEARRLMRSGDKSVVAVLHGPLRSPGILRGADGKRDAGYLAAVAGAAVGRPDRVAVDTIKLPTRGGGSERGRAAAAFGAVFAMFFLTLLLAGQAVGMLAEERGNKVIEILAAAVPLESVFLGKLLGMLGVALLFILFWGGIGAQAIALVPEGVGLSRLAPAIGVPAFALLFLLYFVMAFLLFGAVFLGVGAQAGSMREIQMLSLPITIFQVAMFGLASAAAGAPDSTTGEIAAIFPFSSPFAMAARAATGVPAWQHVAAIAWQLAWLGVTVTIAARLFRRGVLKSGGVKRRVIGL
jgi:ABC-2 type transport system permease protein